jgi:hypothetical protein
MSATLGSTDANRTIEFLFVADQKANSLQGFRIGDDGRLLPVTGSPFQVGDTPRKLLASAGFLIMAGNSAIIIFQVDKLGGALRQTDSVAASSPQVVLNPATGVIQSTANGETTSYRLVKGLMRTIGSSPATIQNKALMLPSATSRISVLRGESLVGERSVMDATGEFEYVLDTQTNQIDAFRIGSNRNLMPLNPPRYSAGEGPVSIALVAP